MFLSIVLMLISTSNAETMKEKYELHLNHQTSSAIYPNSITKLNAPFVKIKPYVIGPIVLSSGVILYISAQRTIDEDLSNPSNNPEEYDKIRRSIELKMNSGLLLMLTGSGMIMYDFLSSKGT